MVAPEPVVPSPKFHAVTDNTGKVGQSVQSVYAGTYSDPCGGDPCCGTYCCGNPYCIEP